MPTYPRVHSLRFEAIYRKYNLSFEPLKSKKTKKNHHKTNKKDQKNFLLNPQRNPTYPLQQHNTQRS